MSIQGISLKLRELSTNSFGRTAAIVGILAAVGGPVAMLAFGRSQASNVPWYVWIVAAVLLVAVVWQGYHKFAAGHDDTDISIRPNNRKTE
jgi:hypothetical protein